MDHEVYTSLKGNSTEASSQNKEDLVLESSDGNGKETSPHKQGKPFSESLGRKQNTKETKKVKKKLK